MDFGYILQNLPWFILLIGGLVFFHELGHFLAAKLFGVGVLRFSLGFGPRVFGFRRGETDYQVALLPLGGYVKMLGEAPGSEDEVAASDVDRAFMNKPTWQRSIIAFAGPGFNFLLAFVVYAVMFTGARTFGDTKLGVVTPGQPAWEAGLRPGDKILAVGGVPIDDWDGLREAIGEQPEVRLKVTYERDGSRLETLLVPQVRDEEDALKDKHRRGRIGVSLQYLKPVLGVVDSRSPAALAGARSGDVIVSVSGQAVTAWHDVRALVAAVPRGAPVVLEVERSPVSVRESEDGANAVGRGDEGRDEVEARKLEVVVRPDESTLALAQRTATFASADTTWGYTGLVNLESLVAEVVEDSPAALAGLQVGDRLLGVKARAQDGQVESHPIGVWSIDLALFQGMDARSAFELTVQRGREVLSRTVTLQVEEQKDEFKQARTVHVFGASNDFESTIGTYTFERSVGVGEGVMRAAKQVGADMTLIGRAVAKLVGGDLPLDAMGGPIMLFVIAEKSAKRGMEYFFQMLAVISVNLGILNLLPVPVLDGGHLLFCAIEAVRRRPPSVRMREIANLIGLVLLLTLMALVMRNDVLRYILD